MTTQPDRLQTSIRQQSFRNPPLPACRFSPSRASLQQAGHSRVNCLNVAKSRSQLPDGINHFRRSAELPCGGKPRTSSPDAGSPCEAGLRCKGSKRVAMPSGSSPMERVCCLRRRRFCLRAAARRAAASADFPLPEPLFAMTGHPSFAQHGAAAMPYCPTPPRLGECYQPGNGAGNPARHAYLPLALHKALWQNAPAFANGNLNVHARTGWLIAGRQGPSAKRMLL